MTPMRVAAIDAKRDGFVLLPDGTTSCGGRGVDGKYGARADAELIDLSKCASGKELIAGHRSRQLFPFMLEQRRGKVHVPTTSRPVHWTFRPAHIKALAWVAAAMIGLQRQGLVISHKELGPLIGLGERQTGTRMRELCDWGLLRANPMHVAKGAASSRRANVYRLTMLAMHVWRLELPTACGQLPMAAPPRAKRAHVKMPRAVTIPGAAIAETPDAPLPGIRQELPANPETPLRGDSSGEHGAFHSAVSAAPTFDFRTAVPDESTGRHTLEGVKARPATFSNRSTERGAPSALPGSLELARPVGVDVALIRHLPADPNARDEYGAPAPYTVPSMRRMPRDDARAAFRRRIFVEGQAAAAIAQRPSKPAAPRRENANPVLDDESGPGGFGDQEPTLLEHLRRERERLAEEHREFAEHRVPRPAKPEPAHDLADLADDIEHAWASLNAKRGYPKDEIPPHSAIALQRMRGRGRGDAGGENGGAS